MECFIKTMMEKKLKSGIIVDKIQNQYLILDDFNQFHIILSNEELVLLTTYFWFENSYIYLPSESKRIKICFEFENIQIEEWFSRYV